MNSYTPGTLQPVGLDYGNLITLVGQANAALARYDGLLQGIINPEVLLSPLTTQEAVLSSKIEGTQATLDEVLEHEAGQKMSPEKTDDILEIVNYRVADASLHARANGSAPLKDLIDSPSIFPFRIKPVHAESLMSASSRLDILRHGLDDDLVMLRKQTTKGGAP